MTFTLLQQALVKHKLSSPMIFGESQFESASELTLDERRAFLKKPLSERRSILAQQAEKMLPHYQSSDEWRELMAGDIMVISSWQSTNDEQKHGNPAQSRVSSSGSTQT
jgi:hypothetical protein